MTDTNEIRTFEALQDAVDQDNESHLIKNLAFLLLTSSNDWPISGLTNISDFLISLKVFYGNPLDKEKIEGKELDLTVEGDSWRHEAGSSILEMIGLGEKHLGIQDIDRLISQILKFYERKKASAQQ